ncbi:YesN/AraC family two-component response regulator [Paenibacillus cellulosilyticus]|uniref:YesN/AraC family two-component response regulator n=1 Tax=Paenibacillus cellulosilyticus TaxID=375489 RepID=A0A2V2YUV6_9BACL|nr:response regulator [Paenibacillus cellulosilyticus]PWW01150.1 YesN/AraC family two-component response regulator [Paenibacillus cellulosilyticus]QKS46886.1 response regulator [Paenibacillus cellulosilyticus]
MHRILIVDDEPLIGQGLSSLLASSGIGIEGIFVAHNGYEALDYIRMEDIDLLITDIQMGAMSGIELMHQAKLVRPWIQTIVISAHETFQYAQLAMRLGAKDYLIKPLDGVQLLDSVRNALLKLEKRTKSREETIETLRDSFRVEEPSALQTVLLNNLLSEDTGSVKPSPSELQKLGIGLAGPYFAVLKLKLLPRAAGAAGSPASERDTQLLRYAALNISSELLAETDRESVVFYSGADELSIMMQWDEESYENTSVSKLDQLDMIGRSLHRSMKRYLGLTTVVGISQIANGLQSLVLLHKQAIQALRWSERHPDHDVFYYGDFHESLYTKEEEPSEDELRAQHNRIAEGAKAYIDRNYAQKGLTLHEVAQNNHVSPNYLSYLFKKTNGMNLWEYVMKLRMEESRRLLLETDMRRYEIAERVGYESPEHFSKIFKKYYGISPSELKK